MVRYFDAGKHRRRIINPAIKNDLTSSLRSKNKIFNRFFILISHIKLSLKRHKHHSLYSYID